MSGNKIPEALRASFLHEEVDLDELLSDPPQDDVGGDGVDYERLCSIMEDSTDNGETESFDFNESVTSMTSGEKSDMVGHRKSMEKFKLMCKSFRVSSPHEMASMAAAGVKDQFRQSLSESLLKDYDKRDCIAPFNTKEIVLGKRLGSGEFSHVYQVKSFRLNNELSEDAIGPDEVETRQYMKSRETYRDTKKSSYALKHLRPELLDKYDSSEYAQFASDLVQEAEFLSTLQHPNIIKLRGIALDDYLGFEQGPKGYFLIIDRLDETLDQRIAKWKRGNNKGGIFTIKRKNTDDSDSSRNDLLSEQLNALLQLAAAFVYLHEKDIIYRDLKPANVGFDVRGDVKLFDFGLAKIMPPNGDSYEDSFEMSGAGSPRYMAPEVLESKPVYNLKADVYTFSIVMWEVLALKKPYAFARGMGSLVDHVGKSILAHLSSVLSTLILPLPDISIVVLLRAIVVEGGRPEINPEWPYSIKDTLSMCFDALPQERPPMSFIFESIRSELVQLRGGDDSELRKSYLLRRRSLASMRQLPGVKRQSKARQMRSSLTASITKFGRQFSSFSEGSTS